MKTPNQKYLKLLARKAIRLSTARFRRLPDFLIIGAGKAGTTSLYDYMCRHSKINPAIYKEVHYFDVNFHQGLNWYRLHFSFRGKTGEASAYYIYHPDAPKRARDVIPKTKIIIILRNPADRAYSQWNHEVRNKNETLSFEDAISAEPSRLKDKSFLSVDRMIFSYLDRGKYASQIRGWLKYFPREQIKIMPFGNITKTDETFEFLGLEPESVNTEHMLNSGGSYKQMKPDTRRKLNDYFKPYNEELFELLDDFNRGVMREIKSEFAV